MLCRPVIDDNKSFVVSNDKINSMVLSTGTDVNKLTTSKDTKTSFLSIKKFLIRSMNSIEFLHRIYL